MKVLKSIELKAEILRCAVFGVLLFHTGRTLEAVKVSQGHAEPLDDLVIFVLSCAIASRLGDSHVHVC
jgi:hypothetical protein